MKIETTTEFKPVKLILETQHEVDAIFALLNFIPLRKIVKMEGTSELLSPFTTNGYLIFHNKIDQHFSE